MEYFKTMYYPVDVENRIIYNDPSRRESDCSVRRGYRDKGTIGVKGERLNTYRCYESFKVLARGMKLVNCTECGNRFGVSDNEPNDQEWICSAKCGRAVIAREIAENPNTIVPHWYNGKEA